MMKTIQDISFTLDDNIIKDVPDAIYIYIYIYIYILYIYIYIYIYIYHTLYSVKLILLLYIELY